MQLDAGHEAEYIMIPVFPAAQNLQMEIDFRICSGFIDQWCARLKCLKKQNYYVALYLSRIICFANI
jgi:hypothetical protein